MVDVLPEKVQIFVPETQDADPRGVKAFISILSKEYILAPDGYVPA